LTTAGSYEVGAVASGKLGENLVWKEPATATVELTWPEWVDRWRKQLTIGAVLLAICALWKPVIVAGLLPFFRLLRLSPTGFYSQSGDDYPETAYRTAMRRRKLFTLTMGCWENRSLDVRVGSVSDWRSDRPRRRFQRLIPNMSEWLHKQPKGRLVTVPFRGLYTESTDGFERSPDSRPTQVRVCNDTVWVCQSDWTERRS